MVAPSFSYNYKGYSTKNRVKGINRYDIELVKQDLLNCINTRKGERRGDPSYGSIIQDMVFEPLTQRNLELIWEDIEAIIKAEKRVELLSLDIKQYENGIRMECKLLYIGTDSEIDLTQDFNNNIQSTSSSNNETISA